MLLKEYYIEKITKRLKAVNIEPTSEYAIGLIEGLEFAIMIMEEEKTK